MIFSVSPTRAARPPSDIWVPVGWDNIGPSFPTSSYYSNSINGFSHLGSPANSVLLRHHRANRRPVLRAPLATVKACEPGRLGGIADQSEEDQIVAKCNSEGVLCLLRCPKELTHGMGNLIQSKLMANRSVAVQLQGGRSHPRRSWIQFLTLAVVVSLPVAAIYYGFFFRSPSQPSPVPFLVPGATPVQRVIVIMKENHAFDNYFGTYPGADGIPENASLPNGAGGTVYPHWLNMSWTPDLPHGRGDMLDAFDGERTTSSQKSPSAPSPGWGTSLSDTMMAARSPTIGLSLTISPWRTTTSHRSSVQRTRIGCTRSQEMRADSPRIPCSGRASMSPRFSINSKRGGFLGGITGSRMTSERRFPFSCVTSSPSLRCRRRWSSWTPSDPISPQPGFPR